MRRHGRVGMHHALCCHAIADHFADFCADGRIADQVFRVCFWFRHLRLCFAAEHRFQQALGLFHLDLRWGGWWLGDHDWRATHCRRSCFNMCRLFGCRSCGTCLYIAHECRTPGATQKGNNAGVGEDQAHQQELADLAQFQAGEPQHEQGQGKCPYPHEERHDAQAEFRCDRNNRQDRAQDRVAKETAQTKGMRPVSARHMGRGVDRSERNCDGCEDYAWDDLVNAAMDHKSDAPDPASHGDAERGYPAQHDQWGSKRGSECAKPILHWRISGGKPARIVG